MGCMLKDRNEDGNSYDNAMHEDEEDEDESDEDDESDAQVDAHHELRASSSKPDTGTKQNDEESIAAVLMSLAATPPLPHQTAGIAPKDAAAQVPKVLPDTPSVVTQSAGKTSNQVPHVLTSAPPVSTQAAGIARKDEAAQVPKAFPESARA